MTPSEDQSLDGTPETSKARETILGFVRGSRPWKELERAGVYVELKEDGCEIDNPWNLLVKVGPRDVAQGLIAYRRMPDQLQSWARIILAGSSFLEFDEEFEATPDGEVLLNAVWDASSGDDLSRKALSLAEHLVKHE